MSNLQTFIDQLAPISNLVPRKVDKRQIAQPSWTKRAVTIVGVKTVLTRFMPVSHEGHSNETYVDKIDLLGKTRAEFIGRKLKGIERRMHMTIVRELIANQNQGEWKSFFENNYAAPCIIPDSLCLACPNCALFGGLDAKAQMATFSRARYLDTFSVQDVTDCVGSMDNEEMGIGNQVYEDLVADKAGKKRTRGSDSFHLYEYVKAGTQFPFITIIESPTLFDVAALLHAIRRADSHGYGKYSANHGKFSTQFLALGIGYPRFSMLDMLSSADEGQQFDSKNMRFDTLGKPAVLTGDAINDVADKLNESATAYLQALK